MKRIERVVEDVYRIRLGVVNAFLIARAGHLTLVDCGYPGRTGKLGDALSSLGFGWQDLRHILITHCHPDHAGSLAAVQSLAPQATTYMHAEDAALVRKGISMSPDRPLKASPGLHNKLLFYGFVRNASSRIEPARVDREVYDTQCLPIAGGISVIHSPGHTRGHVCFLWHGKGGVLFAGDVAACMWGPSYSIAYEDFERAKQTLCELGQHPFECVCFGHGNSLLRSANRRWSKHFVRERNSRLVPAAEGLAIRQPLTRQVAAKPEEATKAVDLGDHRTGPHWPGDHWRQLEIPLAETAHGGRVAERQFQFPPL